MGVLAAARLHPAATGKASRSARCGGRLRVTTLSCSRGSVRATTATAVTSLRFTGRCGVPGGTYREIGGRHDHAMPQALAVPHLGLAADGVNGGLVHVVDMGRRAGCGTLDGAAGGKPGGPAGFCHQVIDQAAGPACHAIRAPLRRPRSIVRVRRGRWRAQPPAASHAGRRRRARAAGRGLVLSAHRHGERRRRNTSAASPPWPRAPPPAG